MNAPPTIHQTDLEVFHTPPDQMKTTALKTCLKEECVQLSTQSSKDRALLIMNNVPI